MSIRHAHLQPDRRTVGRDTAVERRRSIRRPSQRHARHARRLHHEGVRLSSTSRSRQRRLANTGAGVNNEYILVNAMRVRSTNRRRPKANCENPSGGRTYELKGPAERKRNLEAFVGHRIEVSGRIENAKTDLAVGASGELVAGSRLGARQSAKERPASVRDEDGLVQGDPDRAASCPVCRTRGGTGTAPEPAPAPAPEPPVILGTAGTSSGAYRSSENRQSDGADGATRPAVDGRSVRSPHMAAAVERSI